MPRTADAIARTLSEFGTRHFFQLTGGDPSLWTALQREGIRMIPCRTEMGATYMADGYARISGRPGFVYGQHGPGSANVASSLADAMWAMSPVVALTSSTPVATRDRREYQQLDQVAFHRPVTLWSGEAARPEHASSLLRTAIRVATGTPSGPVHLDVPRDVFSAALETPPSDGRAAPEATSGRWAPDPEAISGLIDALLRGERPLILAGSGAIAAGAWDEIQVLARRLQIPVATSPGGKGSIREDDPLAVGVVGRYAGVEANRIAREADTVLALGSSLGSLTTDGFKLFSNADIIQVDVRAEVLGQTYARTFGLVADVRLALQAILAALDDRAAERTTSEWANEVARRVGLWRTTAYDQLPGAGEEGLDPAVVIKAVRDALAPGDIVVADTGYMAAWASVLFPVLEVGRTFLRAAGSLGWAIPGAMGAALAAPDRRVISLVGDGGAGYNILELETAVRCEIPVIVIVLNNRCLAFEYHLQRYDEENVIPEVNDLTDVDYGAVARALGAEGRRVTTLDELQAGLREATASKRPWLLDVIIDKELPAPVTSYEAVLPRTR